MEVVKGDGSHSPPDTRGQGLAGVTHKIWDAKQAGSFSSRGELKVPEGGNWWIYLIVLSCINK